MLLVGDYQMDVHVFLHAEGKAVYLTDMAISSGERHKSEKYCNWNCYEMKDRYMYS